MEIPRCYGGRKAVIVGTGPSLRFDDVAKAQDAGVVVFAVNHAYTVEPDVHVTVNPEWWDNCWQTMPAVRKLPERAWCSDARTCQRYDLHHFDWFDSPDDYGLSDDPQRLHLGHSSGFAALNLAHLMGCTPIGLLGHDMRYPKDYDGRARKPGGKRHYFGEYSKELQHWPTVKVGKDGELNGLIVCYEAVAKRNPDVPIYNLTPGSALTCFPSMTVEDFIDV